MIDRPSNIRLGASGGRRRAGAALLAAAVVAAISPVVGRADDQVFVPTGGFTTGDFNDPNNWVDVNSAGNFRVPTSVDRADIADVGSNTATLSATFGGGTSNPSATMNTLYLGANTDGNANGDTGTIKSNTFGNGVLTQTSGSLTVNTWTVIGGLDQTNSPNNFGTGTYNLQGGSFTQGGTDNIAVGQGSTGTFNISGGATAQINSTLNIGRWSRADNHNQGAGNGFVTVGTAGATNDPTSLTVNGDLTVGLEGTGTFTQNSGTVTNASTGPGGTANGTGWMYIGRSGGSTGTYNMNGGVLNTASRLQVGSNGTGVMNQTGGTVNVGTGTGTANLDLTMGDSGGTGTYNLSGGTLAVPKTFAGGGGVFVGGWSNGNGTLNVSATGVLNTADLVVGRNDPNGGTAATTGLVMQTGGTVNVGAHLMLGNDPSNNSDGHTTGTYTLQAGNLNLGTNGLTIGGGSTAAKAGTGTFNLQGGTLDGGRGTFALGANAPAASAFNMTGGKLQNAGAVQFFLNQQGGTFEAGRIAAPASTAVTGNGTNAYTLAGAPTPATLQEDIESVTSFDQVNATSGAVTITGGNLALHVKAGFTVPTGAQFAIVTSDQPIVGAFAQGATVTADTGQRFTITYNTAPGGGTGNDVVLTSQAVPEPATASAVALAAGAGLLRRRRRR